MNTTSKFGNIDEARAELGRLRARLSELEAIESNALALSELVSLAMERERLPKAIAGCEDAIRAFERERRTGELGELLKTRDAAVAAIESEARTYLAALEAFEAARAKWARAVDGAAEHVREADTFASVHGLGPILERPPLGWPFAQKLLGDLGEERTKALRDVAEALVERAKRSKRTRASAANPAFGEELTPAGIAALVLHVRSLAAP